jgi:polyisoprenoid-binding protein YceI
VSARFQFDPAQSRFTVQAFAAGMLSFLGHNPTFAVRDFTGELQLDPGPPSSARLEIVVKAGSLTLIDKVSPADRREIEGRMRDEVLAVDRYPEIRFESSDVSARPLSGDQFQLRIRGRLTLRGVTAPVEMSSEMHLGGETVRLTGETPLLLSAFRIPPVTALGGTLRLKDQLRVVFDLHGVGVRVAVPAIGGAHE